MTSGADITTRLKERGIRMTKVRRALISVFAELKGPASVTELLDQLKSHELAVNKTTVYREIAFLISEGVVTEVDLLDGMKRYEVAHEHHHHHLVCRSCHTVVCANMEGDLDELESRLSKRYKFTITGHVLEFFGLCSDCRK